MNVHARRPLPDPRFDDSIGWLDASLTDLARHIQRRYHDPLRVELPALLATIAQVEGRHAGRHGMMLTPLRHLFDRFSRSLLIHIRTEDAVVFPAIVAIEAAVAHQRTRPWSGIVQPIELMEADHAAALESLAHMRLLTRGWAIPDDDPPELGALLDALCDLERDTRVHLHLENQVLFPRAVALARAIGAMTA